VTTYNIGGVAQFENKQYLPNYHFRPFNPFENQSPKFDFNFKKTDRAYIEVGPWFVPLPFTFGIWCVTNFIDDPYAGSIPSHYGVTTKEAESNVALIRKLLDTHDAYSFLKGFPETATVPVTTFDQAVAAVFRVDIEKDRGALIQRPSVALSSACALLTDVVEAERGSGPLSLKGCVAALALCKVLPDSLVKVRLLKRVVSQTDRRYACLSLCAIYDLCVVYQHEHQPGIGKWVVLDFLISHAYADGCRYFDTLKNVVMEPDSMFDAPPLEGR
jgi:hypothetical protein